jgi:PII-like signaling protein
MRPSVEAVLLRVFVGEEDRYQGRPLYQAIVATALETHMAGATVLPGSDGYGISRSIRNELNVDAGPRNPMVVEIVDRENQIDRFLLLLNDMVESGLVTLEKVRAIRYRRPDSLESPIESGSTTVAESKTTKLISDVHQ